jgi:tRNA(adenine34) deaminase
MATKKWSAKVNTDSTHPDEGLFKKNPTVIAKALASKKVSPKGPASGMRMLNFYINRAGKNLSDSRHAALEKAKSILSEILVDQKKKEAPKKKSVTGKSSSKTVKSAKKSGRKRSTKTSTRKAA